MKMIPRPTGAEDVLQETFLQPGREAGGYDAERSSVLGWLVMIARSRALDRLRRQAVSTTSEVPDRSVPPEAEAAAALGETQIAVTAALDQLPADSAPWG